MKQHFKLNFTGDEKMENQLFWMGIALFIIIIVIVINLLWEIKTKAKKKRKKTQNY